MLQQERPGLVLAPVSPTFFSLRQFWLIKWSFLIHSTTPFKHRDFILELSRSFAIGEDFVGFERSYRNKMTFYIS